MKETPGIPETSLLECIAYIPDRSVGKLLDLLASKEIVIERGPLTGLIMMSAMDSFETDFHLGEVLVTEAEVRCGEYRGYGMVIGEDPDRAVARAAAEAVWAAPNHLFRKRLNRFLRTEAGKLGKRREKESERIAGTRVRFETMKRT